MTRISMSGPLYPDTRVLQLALQFEFFHICFFIIFF
jgi:hypothetical protein